MRYFLIAAFISFLLLGQLFFSYKSVETFPFFNYGMYSAIQNRPDSVAIVLLLVNNKQMKISNLPSIAQEFLMNNIFYFEYHKQHNYIDDNLITVRNRFKNYLDTANLIFVERQLSNGFVSDADFNSWLVRYLQPFCTEIITRVDYKINYQLY
jgi:hypothetical protein